MNELKHLKDFQTYLKGYRPSKAAITRLNDLRLVLMVGPSSSGRNTIIQQLLKTGEFHFTVSDTTRKPRINDGVMEKDGVDYWFRTEEEMLDEIKNGEFLEAAVIHNQQVSGTSIRELEEARSHNKIAITDIEVVGTANILGIKPDTAVIFICPPEFEIWINRLHGRGEIPEAEVRRRLESAVEEFEAALREDYYTFVVNDQLEDAIASVYEVSTRGVRDSAQQQRGRAVVETLLIETKKYLLQKA